MMTYSQRLVFNMVRGFFVVLFWAVVLFLFLTLWLSLPAAQGQERTARPAARKVEVGKLLVLGAVQAGMETWDMHQTREHWLEAKRDGGWFHEAQPLTRALLPHPGLLYGQVALSAAATTWLSYRMGQSSRAWVRRLRWMPQAVQIGASAQGVAYSRVNWHPRRGR
jgi:hypothetical protein